MDKKKESQRIEYLNVCKTEGRVFSVWGKRAQSLMGEEKQKSLDSEIDSIPPRIRGKTIEPNMSQ